MAGSPLDFNEPHAIGERIEELASERGGLGAQATAGRYRLCGSKGGWCPAPGSRVVCHIQLLPADTTGGYAHTYLLKPLTPENAQSVVGSTFQANDP